MAVEKKKFRVSSALKDIIGRELVTDEFIAVFELVKNAFDANAKRVDITFEGLDTSEPALIIQDDGKGMDRVDLEEKWLFVAYSAKKTGEEDYRDRISSRRIAAGAKGIGRFSCDRLGRLLTIYSKKDVNAASLHRLEVHWEDFERDMHDEFIKIPVGYTATRSNPYELRRGTVLEIKQLRESWNRDKLLRLKHSLEKLINPNQGNDSKGFKIYLHVPAERQADKDVPADEQWNVVNGPIKNLLFEDLGFRTTRIFAGISHDGKQITTRLEDRGKLIYEIVENNPFKIGEEELHDIDIHLFAMNQAAKNFFTRYMGVRVVEYGSVFLYKNGFRIHPIGDVKGGDIFAIDRLKQQHGGTHLGTRDILGRIEINGKNAGFKETSSRDGGLIKNEHFEKLQEFFFEYALRRLQRFAIEVIHYGSPGLGEEFDYKDVEHSPVFELIRGLTKSKDIVQFRYDPKILDIFKEVSEQSLGALLTNFKRLAHETGDDTLAKEARKAEKRLAELQAARIEAEANAARSRQEAEEAEKRADEEAEKARRATAEAESAREEAEQKTSENLFLRSVASQDVVNIVSLHHHIGIAAGAIDNYIKSTTQRIKSGKPITADEFLEILGKIAYQAKKIASTTRFATKANFRLEATKIESDLSNFVQEYVLNVCNGLIFTLDNKKPIEFVWSAPSSSAFMTAFRPLELAIVLDNLISNSRKAKATTIKVEAAVQGDLFRLTIKDNGIGLKEAQKDRVFELGYTTTSGSGLGLHQVADILKTMKGSIELTKGIGSGAGFVIEIPRG